VRYLSYIGLLLGLFWVSSHSKAARPASVEDRKITCENYFRSAFPEKTFPLSLDRKTQLHPSCRQTSPLKRQIGNGFQSNPCFLLAQAPAYAPIFNVQGRDNYILHSLLLLFPKHNFW
jgi:hypothetical protein